MLAYRFEHIFNCDSVENYWKAYFSSEMQDKLDNALGIGSTEILNVVDSEDVMTRTVVKVPNRQLPSFLKKFANGKLVFTQNQRFRKPENRITIDVTNSMFPNRSEIKGEYIVESAGAGKVKRTYTGTVSVTVPLIGKRVEKWVLVDLEKSMNTGASVTQKWLDGNQ